MQFCLCISQHFIRFKELRCIIVSVYDRSFVRSIDWLIYCKIKIRQLWSISISICKITPKHLVNRVLERHRLELDFWSPHALCRKSPKLTWLCLLTKKFWSSKLCRGKNMSNSFLLFHRSILIASNTTNENCEEPISFLWQINSGISSRQDLLSQSGSKKLSNMLTTRQKNPFQSAVNSTNLH